jgi:hypothetical protein
MEQGRTWKDVVANALRELGGQAHINRITEIAKNHPKAEYNQHVKEKVRQVVRAYNIFETATEGSGIYRLVSDAPLANINKAAKTSAITDEIQGKLLYIGRANDFETFAPSNDRTKGKFAGKPLEHFTTVRNLDAVARLKENERKKMSLIDVLWLAEEDGDLFPRFAFEIENSTKVLTGLNRLNVIPPLFQTKLFIVGKDESQEKRYQDFLSSPTFKKHAKRFDFRLFNEIRELFTYAEDYQRAREANNQAMQKAGLSF